MPLEKGFGEAEPPHYLFVCLFIHANPQDTMISLSPTPKKYHTDQDKACTPQETVSRVKAALSGLSLSILAQTRRIDNGVLGIPVFLSICGEDARSVMPTRKQMGKGASPEQAEASALMELMERYGFFTFWRDLPEATQATWEEAKRLFPQTLMPLELVNKACGDTLPHDALERILNLRPWLFVPSTHIATGNTVHVPLDLFKVLNEFNGSSAGNTQVESILQGTCELVERHVCALADKQHPALPSLPVHPESTNDPVLRDLLEKFHRNGIVLVLKDMTMGMPVPTVAALAMNPVTFPETSEIVFTAGTACTPEKAAIRAITEVAQLAGDFCTSASYEASGLPKYRTWEETAWLHQGPQTTYAALPRIEHDDMLVELQEVAHKLEALGFPLFSVSTQNPQTGVPSNYNFVPGFQFRERDEHPSVGLFVLRLLREEADEDTLLAGLATIEAAYPESHFIPFFKGLIALDMGNVEAARAFFAMALPLQPGATSKSLVAFYHAYTLTQEAQWEAAIPLLDTAIANAPDLKEALNLRGVCKFKLERYAEAAQDFTEVIKFIDKSSVMDLFNLGVCHKLMGNTEEARNYLGAALSIDPTFTKAQEHLAELAAIAQE